jgi:glyoxylase-like metal-dependent hydrolase (beta-lactamase superfamily II)
LSADDQYDVYAVRYGRRRERDASRLFFLYQVYDAPDRQLYLDFYFWVIRNGSRTLLLDCGFNRVTGPVRLGEMLMFHRDPLEQLALLGVRAEDVEQIIVSHMHFDHIGNLALFPGAEIVVARAELDYWTGPYSDRPTISFHIEGPEVAYVRDAAQHGRVKFIDEFMEVAPGIRVTRVGGHTPGQLITEVRTPNGTIVLTADAVHFREEMTDDRPFYAFTDLVDMYGAYELLRQKMDEPRVWVVSGHDPVEMERFELVHEDCVDLTKPVRD